MRLILWEWKWDVGHGGWAWVALREVTLFTYEGWLQVSRLQNPQGRYLVSPTKPKPVKYGHPLPADLNYTEMLAKAVIKSLPIDGSGGGDVSAQ